MIPHNIASLLVVSYLRVLPVYRWSPVRQHLVIPMLELSVRRRIAVPQVVEGVHFWSVSKHMRKKKVIHEMRLSEISILLSSLDNSPFLWRCSGADADEEARDESAQDTETRHSNSANVSVSER